MIKIHAYNTAYREGVIDLILHIQQNEFKVPITINEQPDLMDIENFYQKDGNFWVALSENEVVGTVAIKNIGNANAMLRKMFVKESYRGKDKDVSGRLLAQLLNWAGENQFCKIFLGTTPQFLAAHRFYEKNNFIEIKEEELPDEFPVMEVDKKFYCYYLNQLTEPAKPADIRT
jgi:N-acetylglutamate synthase-like GNAT family acetyltransferase